MTTTTEFSDYKDIDSILDSISEKLNDFGIMMVLNPGCADTDGYSFIITDAHNKPEDEFRDELFDNIKPEVMYEWGYDEEDMDDDLEDEVNRKTDDRVDQVLEDIKIIREQL
jgi:hypothetical protein